MKKNGCGVSNSTAMLVLKCLLLMKLTFMVICLFSLQTFAINVHAQEKITLDLQKATLKKAFKSIQKQTSFRFIYNDDMLPEKEEVSINVQGEPLNVVMEKLLANTKLSYKVLSQNMIVIAEKSATATNKDLYAHTVAGRIVNDKNEPLANVSVVEKGTNNGTTTKENGSFSIKVANSDAVLVITNVGFVAQEVPLNGRSTVDVQLKSDDKSMTDVVVVGYGTKKKEALTAAISTVTAKDIENVHNGSTVSAALAGKIPGVTFRMSDSRPGASASVQIRNMGTPLFVIDGIQQDEGQFNNIAPNDIESITVLKDASAAIYGVQSGNGVVLVTTKRGKVGSRNTVTFAGYTGWQNWSRFPKTVNAYDWNVGKVESDMNQKGSTTITPDDLAKYKAGTEKGYQTFDWYDFIVKKNAPLYNLNLNFTGGSDKINYYASLTHLKQYSVLGREFTFERTNFQSNIDAKITDRFKIGAQINGRIETRDNPGVPGGDDYWEARFALLRNTPMERPYANDNPAYVNDIGHNNENWAFLNKKISGYWTQTWRVLQTNLTADWQTPLPGLSVRGLFSYYYANQLLNGHEYTYDVYTFNPVDSTYNRTGGSTNPWRERTQENITSPTTQIQINYNRTFGQHTISASFINERIKRRDQSTWVHAVPTTNVLPLIYFNTMDTYNDVDNTQARIGYVGKLSYSYANKYYLDVFGRRDASYIFPPEHRWGTFPAVTAGWRIGKEDFFKRMVDPLLVSELKIRGSYGLLGNDDPKYLPIGPYDYLDAYNYNSSTVILNGQSVIGSAYRGVPTTNVSWYKCKTLDIGLDFGLFNNKLTGTADYFHRERDGLLDRKYDILMPSELGYGLPYENLNSDAIVGGEFSLMYNGRIKDVGVMIGGNFSYARARDLTKYKPTYFNSMDKYTSASVDRWQNLFWGYESIGQFQSQDQINSYKVDIDGQNNKTLLPGDLIYKDINNDGKIDGADMRPIGWGTGRNPIMNMGLNIALNYKGFDFHADFSGGSGYSFNRNWEMRWPYQNGGNLQQIFFDDRWHREDPYDLNSKWIAGKYPSLRFNDGGHSDYNKNSTFWLVNVHYLRCRTLELGYSLPQRIISRVKVQRARFYINTSNLFSLDNTHQYGIDAEIADDNGLTYPQSKYLNVGFELSF